MRTALLALVLLCSAPALVYAQMKQSYKGPEISQPVKGVGTIVLHTADSAKAAYLNAVRGLLGAGYGIDRQEAPVGYMSTKPRLLPTGTGVRLIVQVTVLPSTTGSDVLLRGLFTWASVFAQGTTLENQELPAIYVSGGNSPTQRAWNGLQEAALLIAPGAKIGYK